MWETTLVGALVANGAIGLAYRAYRYTKGGPIGDVWGQTVLGVLLVAVAVGIAAGAEGLRWVAFGYAALFAVIVMPVWVLGVLLPLRPRALDYGFTVTYWLLLGLIALAALLA